MVESMENLKWKNMKRLRCIQFEVEKYEKIKMYSIPRTPSLAGCGVGPGELMSLDSLCNSLLLHCKVFTRSTGFSQLYECHRLGTKEIDL